MYVGPHDVYPTMDVNFSILTRECKNKKLVDNIFSSNFVLLSMRWIIKLLKRSSLRHIAYFSQLGLRARRLSIKRYHARFCAIMVKYIYIYIYIALEFARLSSRGTTNLLTPLCYRLSRNQIWLTVIHFYPCWIRCLLSSNYCFSRFSI